MKKRILGVFMTLAMILSLLPVTALAVDPPSESDAAAMTLSEFVAAVTENDGVYDGQGAVVTITPASGCRLTHSGHPEIVDGQTPERIQFYDQTAYAQYQRFKGLRDLNISNVTFKLVPPETDIVFCGAWNTTQVTVSPTSWTRSCRLRTRAASHSQTAFLNMWRSAPSRALLPLPLPAVPSPGWADMPSRM